jgi:broad specificity phosphatase PhoE
MEIIIVRHARTNSNEEKTIQAEDSEINDLEEVGRRNVQKDSKKKKLIWFFQAI